jgi:two-component system, cell cycle sensor histidine kinase and response regulator CckA
MQNKSKPTDNKDKNTILIIDDEASVRKFIHNILTSGGYQVLEAENYDEATAILEKAPRKIDLLLIDIALPWKNGFMMAEDLLKIAPHLKVLFMSGQVGAEWTRYQGVPVTDVHFLSKPFGAAELLERVKYLLTWTAPLSARGAL